MCFAGGRRFRCLCCSPEGSWASTLGVHAGRPRGASTLGVHAGPQGCTPTWPPARQPSFPPCLTAHAPSSRIPEQRGSSGNGGAEGPQPPGTLPHTCGLPRGLGLLTRPLVAVGDLLRMVRASSRTPLVGTRFQLFTGVNVPDPHDHLLSSFHRPGSWSTERLSGPPGDARPLVFRSLHSSHCPSLWRVKGEAQTAKLHVETRNKFCLSLDVDLFSREIRACCG